MLPKAKRADTKALDKVFKEGKFLNSPSLTLKYVPGAGRNSRISFIVPKSISKLAVKRNALRRRGYAALGHHIDSLPVPIAGAFIFKKYQPDVTMLEHEIKAILDKIR